MSRMPLSVTVGLASLVLVVLGAAAAPFLAPEGPIAGNLADRLTPPRWLPGTDHPLGTDHLGRDMFARLLYSGQISVVIGVSAVLLSGTIGMLVGLVGGYVGGRVDYVLMRITEMQLAIPFLALAVLVSSVLGQGAINVIVVLGLAGWVLYARVVRALVLTMRELEFVTAARTIGATPPRIILRTILPNVAAPAVVIASLAVSQMIIAEASLSFLGLGVTPATPSWGTMLSDAREYLPVAWWVPTLPGLAVTITVVSVNVAGDWLRDQLDPRLRSQL